MFKMKKISYILILALLFNFSSVALLFANDIVLTDENDHVTKVESYNSANSIESLDIQEVQNVLAQPKHNISFLKGGYDDISHLEYTYTSNGINFKVIEDTNDSYTSVYSTIYIENKDGIFGKFATQNVKIDSSIVTATFEANGQIDTETFSLETISNIPLELKDISDSPISIKSSYNGFPVTDWTYYGTFNYSNRILKYTISAVTALITGIVTASTLGTGAGIVAGTAASVVSSIVTEHMPTVFYSVTMYFKSTIPEEGTFGMHVAEKDITKFYSDSDRTDQIGDTITSISYLDGYVD